MTSIKTLVALVLVCGTLAGCGATANPTGATRLASSNLGALKADADKGPKADADRPEPPAAPKASTKQGFASREASRVADRALRRYSDLLRSWERAWGDAEKDRLEQDMLSTMHGALKDVQDVTSAQGVDSADRRAYDLADRGLDSYARLFRQWEYAYSQSEKRRIVNDMLTDLMRSLQDVQKNY